MKPTFFVTHGKMIPDIKIELIGALKVESTITIRFIAKLPNLLTTRASKKITRNKTKAEKKKYYLL